MSPCDDENMAACYLWPDRSANGRRSGSDTLKQMTRSLYEQPPFRAAAGTEFRPGGLGLTAELAGECGLRPGQLVLDVGCGVGATASFLAEHYGVTAVGLDCSAPSVDEATHRDERVTWILGRAQQIAYPDEHFDAVFCECFLSTQEDAIEVLQEMRRVLRPAGFLAVTDLYLRTPETASSLSSLPADTCLRSAASKDVTLALFESAGFEVSFWRDRSDALRALMASLVFAYGSAAAFWDAALGEYAGLRATVEHSRPGYYLLVARRRGADK
jgi:arsenite methyltransferase